MARYQDTIWCDGCGKEITWSAVVVGVHHYCCRDCMLGYRCECPDQLETEDDRRVPWVTTADLISDFFS